MRERFHIDFPPLVTAWLANVSNQELLWVHWISQIVAKGMIDA